MFASPAAALLDDLAGLDGAALDDAAIIDQITLPERLKSAACAAQARLTVAFDESVRRAAADRGVPAARRGQGVAAQVALARRESPASAARLIGLARGLVRELPQTLDALAAGETSEWRATLVARETATLELADRRRVDADLGPRLGGLGDRAAGDEARRLAYALDPAQLVRRIARAEADRTVSIRPAPDCMAWVTALLPVAQGVAVHAALTKRAETRRAAGDTRSTGQPKADLLVARVTGAEDQDDTGPTSPDVSVCLVMHEQTLLGDSPEPAHASGFGPVPAFLARRLVCEAARVWLRRLHTTADGDLVAVDARRRDFPPPLWEALVARDRWCRTPWCGAPIRHADHVRRHADGGPTSLANGQGLCQACNQAKETAGWQSTVAPGRRHRVVTTTPSGHTYVSTVTPLPVGRDGPSHGEQHPTDVVVDLTAGGQARRHPSSAGAPRQRTG